MHFTTRLLEQLNSRKADIGSEEIHQTGHEQCDTGPAGFGSGDLFGIQD